MSQLYRKERMESVLNKELSALVLEEIDFPDGALVTITNIEVSDDFSKAKIYFSVYPSQGKRDAEKALLSQRADLRWKIRRTMRVRSLPEFEFIFE